MIIVNYWVKYISILLLMIHMLTSYSYVTYKNNGLGNFFFLNYLIFKNQTSLEI